MPIKFPDMQVLLSRTDQVPKIQREGDPNGAGKLAPQVVQEFQARQVRTNRSNDSERSRWRAKESAEHQKKSQKRGSGRKRQTGDTLDIQV